MTSNHSLFRTPAMKIALMGILVAVLVEIFLLQPIRVVSDSMTPTLLPDQIVLLWKPAYGLRLPLTRHYLLRYEKPARGDIVLVRFSVDSHLTQLQEFGNVVKNLLVSRPSNPIKRLIKRVIGIAGDVVEIREKIVYVNHGVYEEDAGTSRRPDSLPKFFSPRDNFGPVLVPAGALFLLGDNRDSSWDSRSGIFFDESAVLGRILKSRSLEESSRR